MKLSGVVISVGLLTTAAGFAHAQSADQENAAPSVAPHRPSFDGGPVTEKDVLSADQQPVKPLKSAPDNGNILVQFGQYVRIYFKYPIKSVRLNDEFTVKAIPETDHIIRFTGLSPGETSMTIEQSDGTETEWGIVTATSAPHLVKVYGWHGRARNDTGEATSDSPNFTGYIAIQCNEVHCGPVNNKQPPPPPMPPEADE